MDTPKFSIANLFAHRFHLFSEQEVKVDQTPLAYEGEALLLTVLNCFLKSTF